MRRSRVVLSIAAGLVLCAGVVVGRLSGPKGTAGGRGGPGGRGWFVDALDLSPEQQKQMDAIWADTRGQIGKLGDRRHEADHKRDAAVQALLTGEQRAAFEKISADHKAARLSLDQEKDRLVRDASDRSKALLTDAQKAQWEAMGRDRHGGDPHGGEPHGGRPPPGPPPASGPSGPGERNR